MSFAIFLSEHPRMSAISFCVMRGGSGGASANSGQSLRRFGRPLGNTLSHTQICPQFQHRQARIRFPLRDSFDEARVSMSIFSLSHDEMIYMLKLIFGDSGNCRIPAEPIRQEPHNEREVVCLTAEAEGA